ncbi:MAG: hypothetical protein AB7R89_01960 [Dehalococcoidia bacterium]
MLQHAPRPALGRVTALVETAGHGASVMALLLVGVLTDRASLAHLLLFCGSAMCAVSMGVAVYRSWSDTEW